MTREIEVQGQKFKLYKVRGYDNAWCSDQRIIKQIERKRQELYREISLTPKQAKAIEEGRF